MSGPTLAGMSTRNEFFSKILLSFFFADLIVFFPAGMGDGPSRIVSYRIVSYQTPTLISGQS